MYRSRPIEDLHFSRILAKNMRQLRLARRMSVQDLVDAIKADGHHVSRTALAQYESRSTASVPYAMTVDQLMWLAKAFRVLPESLLNDLGEATCADCLNAPPEGFTCNTCGAGGH